MYDKIRQAMLAAFRRDHPENEDNVEIILDEDKKRIDMQVNKLVVEDVTDPTHEIDLEAAKKVTRRAKLGDTIAIPVETKKFGRIAAQAAKQVIIQGIREAERGLIYEEFTSREHEILTGIVSRVDPRTGAVSIRISSNSEFTEAMLPMNERIRGEEFREGDRIKVYVVEVRNASRGPQGCPRVRDCQRTRRGEDRHCQLQRGPGGLHRCGSQPIGSHQRDHAGRRQELPGCGPRQPALPRHRQGRAECAPGCKAHRV